MVSSERTVRAVVRDVIRAEAPGEWARLQELLEYGDTYVVRVLSGRDRGANRQRDPLGFGIPEAVAVASPVVTSLVWMVVDEARRRAASAAVDRTAGWLRAAVGRFRGRPPETPETIPPLTAQQLEAVHKRVVDRAADVGLASADAERLADAVVSRLARES